MDVGRQWPHDIDAIAAKQLHPKFKFENTLVLAFGQTHQQDQESGDWLRPVKSSDKIDFDTIGRFTLGGFVDPYVALTLDSQFYEERPGYGTKSLNPMSLGEFAGVGVPAWMTRSRLHEATNSPALPMAVSMVILMRVPSVQRTW